MVFKRYDDIESFKEDTLDILLEDEVRNNLPLSIVSASSKYNHDTWLLATVRDDQGSVALIAVCTKPFNILLYEPSGILNKESIGFLSYNLKKTGFIPPGVLAESNLARCFADSFCSDDACKLKMSMIIMKLDKLTDVKKAPGFCRVLTESDLSYTPSWEHAFCVDCDLPTYTYADNYERIKSRIGKDTHYIWENGEPVAQAVFGRETPNGAAVNWVYTPPRFRGQGYATAVVAEVSKMLLERGKKFCFLFADGANPASCAVYHKIGYYDVCMFDEIKFDTML